MSFDFAETLLVGNPRTLFVKHPATGDTIAEIDLLSIDDTRPTEFRRAQERRLVKAGRRNAGNIDLDELRGQAIDLLVACTVGWRNISWKGEEMPFNPPNAKMLYESLPWLKDQVDKFVNEVANFLEKSASPSATS